jgi:tRNA G18 (ribose-2'-O)-methylase SpoU
VSEPACSRSQLSFNLQQHSPTPSFTLQLLQSVRVVLVAPKTPANIGAVARVCANFEAPELVLVAPRCDPADGDIVKVGWTRGTWCMQLAALLSASLPHRA